MNASLFVFQSCLLVLCKQTQGSWSLITGLQNLASNVCERCKNQQQGDERLNHLV